MTNSFSINALFGVKESPELQRQIDTISQTIKNGFQQVLGVAIPSMTVGAFARITDNMALRIEKLSNAGKHLNMGVQEIDKWTGAMEIAGVSADQFIGTLNNINNQIREISRGQRPAMWIESIRGWLPSGDGYRGANGSVKWLQDVAQMAKDNDVKNNPQLYAEMSNALSKMGVDGKTAFALLNGELDKYLKRAEELGIVTKEDEKKARSYLFAHRSMERAFTVLQTKIMGALAPAFEFLADCVVKLTKYTDVLLPALLALVAPSILSGLKALGAFLFNSKAMVLVTAVTMLAAGLQKVAGILEEKGFKTLAELVKHPLTIAAAGLAGYAGVKKLAGRFHKGTGPNDPSTTTEEGQRTPLEKIRDNFWGIFGLGNQENRQIDSKLINITADVVNVNGKVNGNLNDWPTNSRSDRAREYNNKKKQDNTPAPNTSNPTPAPQPQPKRKPDKILDLGITQSDSAGRRQRLRTGIQTVTNGLKTGVTTVGTALGGAVTQVGQKVKNATLLTNNPLGRLNYNLDMVKMNNRLQHGGNWAETAANSTGMQKTMANMVVGWQNLNTKINDVKGRLQYKTDWAKEYNQQFNGGNWLKTVGDITGIRKNETIIPWEKAKGTLEKGSQKVATVGNVAMDNIRESLQQLDIGELAQHTWQQAKAKAKNTVAPIAHQWNTFNQANQGNLGRTFLDFTNLSTVARQGKTIMSRTSMDMERMVMQARISGVAVINAASRNSTRVIQNISSNSEGFLSNLNRSLSRLSSKIKTISNKMGQQGFGKEAKALVAASGFAEMANQGVQAKETGKLDLISSVLSLITAIAPFFGHYGQAAAIAAGGANMLYEGYKASNNGEGFGWATVDVGGQNNNGNTTNNTYIYNVSGNLDSGLMSGGMPGTKGYSGGT